MLRLIACEPVACLAEDTCYADCGDLTKWCTAWPFARLYDVNDDICHWEEPIDDASVHVRACVRACINAYKMRRATRCEVVGGRVDASHMGSSRRGDAAGGGRDAGALRLCRETSIAGMEGGGDMRPRDRFRRGTQMHFHLAHSGETDLPPAASRLWRPRGEASPAELQAPRNHALGPLAAAMAGVRFHCCRIRDQLTSPAAMCFRLPCRQTRTDTFSHSFLWVRLHPAACPPSSGKALGGTLPAAPRVAAHSVSFTCGPDHGCLVRRPG